MKPKHTHPYEILTGFKSFAFFIVPILIQHAFSDFQNILAALSTSILNLTLAISLVLYVIFIYLNKIWNLSSSAFFLKSGILFKSKLYLNTRDIHSITIFKGVFMSLFRVCNININPSGTERFSLKNLYLSNKVSRKLLKNIFNDNYYHTKYKTDFIKIFIMCISWSNPATGVFIVIPLLKKVVKILGVELSKKVYSTVDVSKNLIDIGIPPVTSSIIIITVIVMIISISNQFLKHSRLSIFINPQSICIKKGLLSRSQKIIKKDYISSVSFRQTLLTKFLKIQAVYIHSVRDGHSKSETDFIAAYPSEKDRFLLISKIMKINDTVSFTIRPDSKSLKSFLLFPLIFISILLLTTFIKFEGLYSELFITLIVILWIYAVWWFVIKFYAYKISNLSFQHGILCIGGYRKFSLVNSFIPITKIQNIVIKQNPFQYVFKKCNVYIYPYYNYKEYFLVKHLKYSDVEKFVETLENLSIND